MSNHAALRPDQDKITGALTVLVQAVRPEWDTRAIRPVIDQLLTDGRDLADLTHAAIRTAQDHAMRRPTAISFDSDHWRPTVRQAETPAERADRLARQTTTAAERRRCTLCDDHGRLPSGHPVHPRPRSTRTRPPRCRPRPSRPRHPPPAGDPTVTDQHTQQLTEQLRRHLGEIPDLYALLGLVALPGSRPADPDARTTSRTNPSRPPLALDVLDLVDERTKADADPNRGDYDLDRRAGSRRQGVVPTLASRVRLVDGELWDAGIDHLAPDDQPTATSETRYLLSHLAWIVEQRWAHELADDTAAIRHDMRRAIGDRDQTMRCPNCAWYVEERDARTWAICTGCGKAWTYANELDRLNAEQHDRVHLRTAADAIGRPYDTVKTWVKRGWLAPAARDTRGLLYSLTAVRALAQTIHHGRKTAKA